MGSPYREAEHIPDRDVAEDAPAPLASYDVSGRDGASGAHGHNGSHGGGNGHDAGPPTPGEAAGSIRLELAAEHDDAVVALRGVAIAPDGRRTTIETSVIVGDAGVIALRALGGHGGRGGNGGHGGDGFRGSDGSDATSYSSGSDGGDGGPGGDGGNATSGGAGGAGGDIVIGCSDADTPLLMLLDHALAGGTGGAAGINGRGGDGGPGGDGGDSYSWTTTSSYTDSNGVSHTQTHHHSNPGGSDGSRGPDGSPGNARVRPGGPGADGTFAIEVATADGIATYPSRYDLRLASFAHDSANADCVYEPGEIVRVFDLEVENVGGMPTPSQDELALGLVAGGWVRPEPGDLRCAPGLAPGARHEVAGELRFRIADHTPTAPGEPLEAEESIVQRALLPSVRRELPGYQAGDAIDAGRFVIRFPARASAVSSLRSLVPGEATRVRFSITNQSRFALGARSDSKRVLRVVVAAAADTEIGDDHVGFVADGGDERSEATGGGGPAGFAGGAGGEAPRGIEMAPSTGWVHELDRLGAGETAELELTVAVRASAPEYRRFSARVALELGRLDDPPAARPIQYRGFDLRVARPFAVSDADLLLVVNHRTTREEIGAWEALARRLAFKLAIWDLTRERHLDLDRPLADGVSLASWFEHKAIAILDNEIDGPNGPIYPHVFLAADQAVRAAAAGIDLAFVGKGPALPHLLIPEVEGKDRKSLYRRYWFRWWARPESEWLARAALGVSDRLRIRQPSERHVVVHRFAPEVASRFLWIKKWKVGTIETGRTLDAAAGAIVHAEVDDAGLHDPAYAASGEATTAVLAMFGFDENLERMRRALVEIEVVEATLTTIADALVVDLANELAAVVAPGTGAAAIKDLDRALPRAVALGTSRLSAGYDTAGGNALIRLAGRIRFIADSQVPWWQKAPPWRWTRREARARAHILDHVDRFLAGAFGDHNLVQTRADAIVIAETLVEHHGKTHAALAAGKRREWSLELARAPLAANGITSDTEVLTTSAELVLPGDDYDAIAAARADDARLREVLVAAAEAQHAALVVAPPPPQPK